MEGDKGSFQIYEEANAKVWRPEGKSITGIYKSMHNCTSKYFRSSKQEITNCIRFAEMRDPNVVVTVRRGLHELQLDEVHFDKQLLLKDALFYDLSRNRLLF